MENTQIRGTKSAFKSFIFGIYSKRRLKIIGFRLFHVFLKKRSIDSLLELSVLPFPIQYGVFVAFFLPIYLVFSSKSFFLHLFSSRSLRFSFLVLFLWCFFYFVGYGQMKKYFIVKGRRRGHTEVEKVSEKEIFQRTLAAKLWRNNSFDSRTFTNIMVGAWC